MIAKIRELADEHKGLFATCYSHQAGDTRLARRMLRTQLKETYGLDPMTIIVLVQIAIRIWAWAKQHGFLTAYGVHAVPMGQILDDAEADGDLD